jgi:HEAT repeat protein
MGPKATPAVPALIEMAKTAEGYLRLDAAIALRSIDPREVDAVVSALIATLSDPFLPLRRDAARELGKIGPPARAAVPALVAARDYRPRPGPAPAAREPGTSDLAVVVTMPEDEFYPQVRGAAIDALRKIEGGATP